MNTTNTNNVNTATNAADAARIALQKRQRSAQRRLGALFRGGHFVTNDVPIHSFSSMPIGAKASGLAISSMADIIGVGTNNIASLFQGDTIGKMVAIGAKGIISGMFSKVGSIGFARGDWNQQNIDNTIENTFNRFERIENMTWGDGSADRIDKLSRRRFFRTPIASRAAGATYASMAADTIELRKLYELRTEKIREAATASSNVIREVFDLEGVERQLKEPMPEFKTKAAKQAYLRKRKILDRAASKVRYKNAHSEFNSYTPYLTRGAVKDFAHGIGNLFMPSQFQTNNLTPMEKLRWIEGLSPAERKQMFSPWKNWVASLKSITTDPIKGAQARFRIRDSVGNPVTEMNPVLNSTIAEHEFAKRNRIQLGEYVDAFGDAADPRHKNITSMYQKYGPKVMEKLGGYLNLGFSAYTMYSEREAVGTERLATVANVGTWNILFATGIDNYLSKGWGAGKAVGSFIGQSAYSATYGVAKGSAYVGRAVAGNIHSTIAGIAGRAVDVNASYLNRGLNAGARAAGGVLNALGSVPVLGVPFRAPGAAARAYGSVASRIPSAGGFAKGLTTLSNIGVQGLVRGIAGLAGGVVGFVALGFAGEIPGMVMNYNTSTGREARMRRDIMATEQAMPNQHLTNPFAQHVLATERQRALAFSRQSGIAMNSIMGRESVVFHQ